MKPEQLPNQPRGPDAEPPAPESSSTSEPGGSPARPASSRQTPPTIFTSSADADEPGLEPGDLIGVALRRAFEQVAGEPIPDRFKALLDRLGPPMPESASASAPEPAPADGDPDGPEA